MATVTLEPGDTIMSFGSGGGGYGPPSERDPERVRRDVAEGWVTRDRAELVYRVALDPAGNVDLAGTAALRAGVSAETA
jgi:N-methylhydantoinase B